MSINLATYTGDFTPSGCMPVDVPHFLEMHHKADTLVHSRAVASRASQLALRFGACVSDARDAGWLHDVSAVVDNQDRVALAQQLDIAILEGENRLPMILHQKLSRRFAEVLFGVENTAILRAVGCHTTLKREADLLDKILFVADKIAWDQAGSPPYLDALNRALNYSLDAGVCVYLTFLWDQRGTLPVVHPWMADAVHELCQLA
ncbi:MAG: HD domain-containing protein [Anaerolineae bacterium]|nr:HD domain-containing protein [Anaerolineae bacterium]